MAHEDLNRGGREEASSDRAFGWVFSAVFLLVAAWPLLHGAAVLWEFAAGSVVFALIAWLKPALLAIPNRMWLALGKLLGRVVSPIALGILFYGVLTPIGIILRLAGKDLLRLKLDPAADSYWIPRDPPGPPPDSMTNQF